MPYLVLALGSMMSVIGVLSIAWGFPVIQVERGWATVIAGSTLLAGGVITAALGLVLKSLSDLARAPAASAVGPLAAHLPAAPAGEAFDFHGLDLAVAVAAATAVPARSPPEVMAFAPDRSQDGGIPEADVSAVQPAQHDIEDEPQSPVPTEETVLHEPDHGPLESSVLADPVELVEASDPVDETPKPTLDPAPAMDEWLDRSFADFDRDTDIHPAEPDLSLDVESKTAPETPPEPLIAPPQPSPDPALAVIGRYEAEGTSYIMYADGSIDAQSPSGVYRFASMAELKTFIEG